MSLAILLITVFHLCCSRARREGQPVPSEDALSVVGDSLKSGDPEITRLPFSAHTTEEYMTDLVKNVPRLYTLPEIRKINYIILDSSRMTTCYSGKPASSAFNFKTYRYKFPTIGPYHMHLICDTTLTDYQQGADVRKDCRPHMFRIHAYLSMYNSTTGVANIINVQYKGHAMHDGRRTFDIDKNYNITVQDFHLSTETEDAIEIAGRKYTITIMANGDIVIKKGEVITTDEATGKILTRFPPTTTIISSDGTKK